MTTAAGEAHEPGPGAGGPAPGRPPSCPEPTRARTLSLWTATALAATAALVAVSGGLALRGGPVSLSLRAPVTPALLACLVLIVHVARRPRQALARDLRALWLDLHRGGPALVAAAAFGTLAVGIASGTYAVGGSDSHCYVAQAHLFAAGRVALDEPIGRDGPWPEAALTVAPAGFVPRPGAPGESVPICPPGYPLVMAVFVALGLPAAAFYVVPALGAILVLTAGAIGRLAGGHAAGALAAMLTAASPPLLYQVVQPMSDVPAAAWWLAAVLFVLRPGVRAAGIGGLATALAIATRPNLVPLAALLAFSLVLAPPTLGPRVTRAVVFGVAAAPGAALVGWLQWVMFGSPLQSGYGSLSILFSSAHVSPNLARYARWFLAAHTAVPLAGVCALVLRGSPDVAREPDRRASRWRMRVIAAFVAVTLGCYLPYVPFTEWWYLRFLLPAIPLLLVLFAAWFIAVLERAPVATRGPVVIALTTTLLALQLAAARDGFVFGLADLERRFVETGRYVAAHLPSAAVVITRQQSGAVHHDGHRSVLVWDALRPDSLEPAIAYLQAHGRPPYLLLESDEEEAFRRRFAAASELGVLDWPPTAQIGTRVRLYDPSDRARFRRGERVETTYVWYARVRRPSRR